LPSIQAGRKPPAKRAKGFWRSSFPGTAYVKNSRRVRIFHRQGLPCRLATR